MRQRTVDVVVVGGGVAGLAAAARMRAAGVDVVVLEARMRPGGRIATVSGLPPLELGAEFLPADGQAARRLAEAGAVLAPVATGQGRVRDGAIQRLDLGDAIGPALAALPDPDPDSPDTSLADALTRADVEATAAEQLRRYVEQYHAAPADEVSARWVAAVEATGEGGGGGEQVRVLDGLARLPRLLLEDVGAERLRFGHRVTRVRVQPDGVRVDVEGAGEWRARGAVVTVPIGVLRSGRLAVEPIPPAHRAALDGLRMGAVVKLVLQFRRPFWDDRALEGLTFLQDDGPFPTIWTPAPVRAPTLVAWAGGPAAAALARQAPDVEGLVERAVEQLARMFGAEPGRVRDRVARAERHDWSADPEAGGAYPWARVGAAGAAADLRAPVDGRLILTGDGMAAEMGTVDGALSAGWGAAGRLLETIG